MWMSVLDGFSCAGLATFVFGYTGMFVFSDESFGGALIVVRVGAFAAVAGVGIFLGDSVRSTDFLYFAY